MATNINGIDNFGWGDLHKFNLQNRDLKLPMLWLEFPNLITGNYLTPGVGNSNKEINFAFLIISKATKGNAIEQATEDVLYVDQPEHKSAKDEIERCEYLGEYIFAKLYNEFKQPNSNFKSFKIVDNNYNAIPFLQWFADGLVGVRYEMAIRSNYPDVLCVDLFDVATFNLNDAICQQ